MNRTRLRLERSLDVLDIEVSTLLSSHPEATDFWPRFAALADELMQRSDPLDQDWLMARIGAMLSTHGVQGSYPLF
ncbi:hypothetical protein [Dyella sp. C11]|uniref:hypothetical protein n=1 Tax=Dyella sp. C11 TaxID=2126991 RepID=UPI000D64D776|nr:hypothetical protein [Dyella sp. C11]